MTRNGPDAPEKDWQQTIVDLAVLHRWRVMHVRTTTGKGGTHTTPTSIVGWPDLFLWHEDRGPLAVEVKSEKGRVTKNQREVLRSLEAAGIPTAVWRPSDWDVVVEELTSDAMTCDRCLRPWS